MTAAVLRDLTPWGVALLIGLLIVWTSLRLSGLSWPGWTVIGERWRGVHHCERGAVQSLSLVLTLPLFVMFVLFVIQVSQVMIGTMIVHWAAFAAARAAIVWLPADVSIAEPANLLNINVTGDAQRMVLSTGSLTASSPAIADRMAGSLKCQAVFSAAVLACMPAAPSRDVWNGDQVAQTLASTPILGQAVPVLLQSYPLPQNSSRQGAIRRRLENKLAYSLKNTAIRIDWRETPQANSDVIYGPTYNPRNHPDPQVNLSHWNPREVGWEDAVTVWVAHRFALLPGPGRFMSKFIQRADGGDDATSRRIRMQEQTSKEQLYTTELAASATMTNEGLKSVQRYVPQP